MFFAHHDHVGHAEMILFSRNCTVRNHTDIPCPQKSGELLRLWYGENWRKPCWAKRNGCHAGFNKVKRWSRPIDRSYRDDGAKNKPVMRTNQEQGPPKKSPSCPDPVFPYLAGNTTLAELGICFSVPGPEEDYEQTEQILHKWWRWCWQNEAGVRIGLCYHVQC